MDNKDFIRQDNNYRTLKAFQKAECVYDVTYYFANKFLQKGDRTIDQMVQAARSGKQNIAEGCTDSTMSWEMELKLLNVAMGSLKELLEDYHDYLRVHELPIWALDSEKGIQCRQVCMKHNDSAYYREAIKVRGDEAIANIAITLIHQCDTLLRKLIEHCKHDFLVHGGSREEMSRARIKYRNKHK